MDGVYIDSDLSEDDRRRQIYGGRIFLLSPTPASRALAAFPRASAEEAFAPLHPRTAHRELPVEKYVAILAELKPRFINHPRCKDLLRDLLRETGCDLEKT